MKEFLEMLRRNKSGIAIAAGIFIPVAIIWSIVWSTRDGQLNLWPFAFAGGVFALILSFSYLFRNNP